jgi:hypothetical protein
MSSPVLIDPREADDDAVAAAFDTINAVASITELPSRENSADENLTGLVRPVSGRPPPEPSQPTPPAPLHLRVDQ